MEPQAPSGGEPQKKDAIDENSPSKEATIKSPTQVKIEALAQDLSLIVARLEKKAIKEKKLREEEQKLAAEAAAKTLEA